MAKLRHCFLVIGLLALALLPADSLPVDKKAKKEEESSENEVHHRENDLNALEYERYLKEVVSVLESDPEFRAKLDKAEEADIRSGKIAQELDYVNHNVRSRLNELKRQELERLRHLARQAYELSNGVDRRHLKIPEHLDHVNSDTFEVEDLKKLILKTSADLAENDRKRREEFREYELQKEFEHQEMVRNMDDTHRKQFEEDLKKQKEKHNKHEKVHHPGSKDQLEEVWEKQDHMDPQDFDPKTFFMLHDLDGNGYWDETEVKALFVKELDKVYQSGLPEDDMRERAEDMERMREHVFKEADKDKDHLISFSEFLDQTKREEFNRDPGWDTVDNVPQYTHEEYLEFERKRREEIDRLVREGKLKTHPDMPPGYELHNDPNQLPSHLQYPPPPPPHFQQYPQQGQQQQQQQHHPGQQVNLQSNQVYQTVQQPPVQQQQQPQYQQPPVQQQQYQPPPPPAPQAQPQGNYQQQAGQPQQQQYQQPPPQQQQQQYQQPAPVQHQQPQVNNAPNSQTAQQANLPPPAQQQPRPVVPPSQG